MKRTKDAWQILKKRVENNRRLKPLVEEERVNLQAALAIREARKKAGLTQAQLAGEIGTTQSVIARLENADYRGHTLRVVEAIAAALGRRVEIRLLPPGGREYRSYAR